MGNAILKDGIYYLDVYYVPTTQELFKQHIEAASRTRRLPKFSPDRISRLFALYTHILSEGRIQWDNDASFVFRMGNSQYFEVSHKSILRDMHILEDLGLVFRRGESMIDGRCLQHSELYPKKNEDNEKKE